MKTAIARLEIRLLFALILLPHPAWAESLGEADIRGLYAKMGAAAHDPRQSRAIRQQRLDDNFQMLVKSTRDMGDGSPQVNEATMSKSQLIGGDGQAGPTINISGPQNTIQSITYSPDGQSAYVTFTVESEKKMNVPQGNQFSSDMAYKESLSCVDALTLKGDAIRITHSDCTQHIVVKKP